MIQSTELDQLFTSLAEFQSRVGSVSKTATNPFFKSKYAALPDVVAAASPILTECGLCVTQHLGQNDRGDTLTTIVGHKSGQHIGDVMQLRPIKDDPQAQGSATSYGRRYAYMAALGLVAEEDDDGQAASQGTRAKTSSGAARTKGGAAAATAPEPAKPSKADYAAASVAGPVLKKLRKQFEDVGKTEDWLRLTLVGECGVSNVDDLKAAMESLSLDQAVKLMEAMGGKADGLV